MNGSQDAGGRSFDGGPVLKNMYKIKQPATRFVFIDDFGEDWDAAWAVCWSRPSWWNPVPARHGAGTTLAMADGHSEWWAWKDQRTIELMEKWDWDRLGDNLQIQQQGNPDLMLIQKAAWGESGLHVPALILSYPQRVAAGCVIDGGQLSPAGVGCSCRPIRGPAGCRWRRATWTWATSYSAKARIRRNWASASRGAANGNQATWCACRLWNCCCST